MNKTLTMQEILNNTELLNVLSTFREEEEIKEFCEENSIEVTPTVLFNLKKTLESQIKAIERVNEALTPETLNDVAGGLKSGDYNIYTDWATLAGFDSKHWFGTFTGLVVDGSMQVGFARQGCAAEEAYMQKAASKKLSRTKVNISVAE